MRKSLPVVGIFIVVVLFTLMGATFEIGEWQQGIVIQLGKPVRNVTDPGLHFKIPFLQRVERLDKRLLEYDASARELITKDKQQVVVDNYSRWRIVKPLLFFQSVRTEGGAQSRLDDIIYSALREKIGMVTLGELVSGNRDELLKSVLKESNDKSKAFGIHVADVRIKRTDLPEKNEQNVFARMRTERERLAKKFRAEGEEEARKIRSTAEKEARIIQANAKKQSEIIRGEGDAKSTRIYISAYNRDPQFYAFLRNLETYRNVLKENTKIVITPQSDFLRTFKSGK